jgi:LysM repeat protein
LKLAKGGQVTIIDKDPQRKESAAGQEARVKNAEIATKSSTYVVQTGSTLTARMWIIFSWA